MHPITQKLLDAALAMGGTATTKTQDCGYLGTGEFGTPWITPDGSGNIHSPGAHVDPVPFTLVTVTFATPVPFGDLTDAVGGKRGWSYPIPGLLGRRFDIKRLTIYDHPRLTPMLGERGQGLLIAQGENARGYGRGLHLNLEPDGINEAMFG